MKGARHIVFFGLLAVLVMQTEICSAKPCFSLEGPFNIQRAFDSFLRALAAPFVGNTGDAATRVTTSGAVAPAAGTAAGSGAAGNGRAVVPGGAAARAGATEGGVSSASNTAGTGAATT